MKIKKKLPRRKLVKKRTIKKGKKRVVGKKQVALSELERTEKNPIISPRSGNNWEAWQTFNPGVIFLDNKIHFLYRAIGHDGLSRFGYAYSSDGFAIDERLPHPAYEHRLKWTKFNFYSFASGGSFGGCEDPRLVRVNDEDTVHMIYTACDNCLGLAITSIKVKDFLKKNWRWKDPVMISPPDEVHKNWVIFPEKIKGKYAILHSIIPEISIAYRDDLEFPEGEYIKSYYDCAFRRKNCWDNWVRGVGAPPLKTKHGWLLFYHAMDDSDPGKYKVGAMLLDLDDPTKILYRSNEPVLEPEKDYENSGFKPGVVYVSGAVVKNGELLVYYGAADSYVGVAHVNLDAFLKQLMRSSKPKLKTEIVRKK